ncbi:MAG: hypothetical protein M1132_10585 [Chloroflexi bacterium]|nr:hypothetical protein [Chloroflexota bacterium]
MWDWIVANKEWVFSGIGVAALLTIVQLVRNRIEHHVPRGEPATAYPPLAQAIPQKPLEYEFLPLSFDVSLNQEIPQIAIWLYAVNYLPTALEFRSLQVRNIYLSTGPDLASIPATDEVRVPARHSKLVHCRRALLDAEVRAIDKKSLTAPWNATLAITCKIVQGRKEAPYGSGLISMNGWVAGRTG